MTTAAASVNPRTKYFVLVGAIVVQLILGTVYGYSIFWEPLQAEIFPQAVTAARHAEMVASGADVSGVSVVADAGALAERASTERGYLKYAFSICILSFAFVMVIAGRLQDIKGPRFTATIGAVLMGTGFILAGLMNSPIVFTLAHAAFTGAVATVLLMVFHALFGKLDPYEVPIVKYIPMGIIAAVVTGSVLLGQGSIGQGGELDKVFLLWGTIGFTAGAGIGFAYVCPIAALIKWFPEKKGLVSGLAVAGFGLGAYFFKGGENIVSIPVGDSDVSLPIPGALGFMRDHGVQSLFVVHGFVCLVGISLGAMLLKNPPVDEKGSKHDSKHAFEEIADGETTWQQTLRRPAFYVLWLMFFSGAMAGLMVIGILKVFAGEQLIAAASVSASSSGEALSSAARSEWMSKGAAAVGWLAIFNAVGRVVWGFVSDFVGRYVALAAMFLFQAVTMFLLVNAQSEMSIAVAASIVGFNFGGNFALFPSATADLFGARNMGANYGWVFTSYGIAGVVGIAAGNVAKSMTGSYSAAFTVSAGLCVVSAGLAIGLWRWSRREQRRERIG